MKKLLLLLILSLGVFSSQAAPEYGTVTVSKVISVYDGDTFRVDIDSLPPIVGKNIPIRQILQKYKESVNMRRI